MYSRYWPAQFEVMMKSASVSFVFLLWTATAAAQQYVISTYAGGALLPTPARGLDLPSASASGVASDAVGNIYFLSANSVFKLDQSGALTRVAGNSRPGYSGDGGPAPSARLRVGLLAGVAVDNSGNVFISDTGNHCIRRVSSSGIITTVAGNGAGGFSGDGGPATDAHLNGPTGLAVDRAGALFLSDYGNRRIRKVSVSGIITTVAGNGSSGFSGDGGPATSAQLNGDIGVAVDDAGNLFLGGNVTGRVRKVSAGGIITTVAGGGDMGRPRVPADTFEGGGDGGPATSAQLVWPSGVAVDSAGALIIADYTGGRIRKVSPSGIITTVAGSGPSFPPGFSGDGGPATSAALGLPISVAVNGAGELFIAAGRHIRKVSPSGTITTVAGNGSNACCFSGDGGPAINAQLSAATGAALDGAGNLFIADRDNARIRKVSPSGIITTVAGSGPSGPAPRGFSGDGGPATSAQLSSPISVAVDGAGNLFIADLGNNRIRRVSPSGIITTVAGNGVQGFSGDGGPATSAQLSAPFGVAVDGAGNLFIADIGNNLIRKVSRNGIITTVAGDVSLVASDVSLLGSTGDGGPATSARLSAPISVAVDGAGNLFIVVNGDEDENFRFTDAGIRKVSPSGIITTVASSEMLLGYPIGMAVDGAGNLFIAISDRIWGLGNERIRKVSPSGLITTVAGTGAGGFSGDGGPAFTATLSGPVGLAVDAAGNVYVADSGNSAVRILRPTNQSVLIGAVVDAASQRADPASPGKIVVIYGAGLGPSQLVRNQPGNGQFGTELAGTNVSFNGIASPILYTSATQVAAVVPYAVTGTTAQVTVTYRGEVSTAFTVPVATSAPSIFTRNQAGSGQAAAINAVDGTANTAANPVKIGGFISLYATGEGQTAPAGVDGRLGSSTPAPPVLPYLVTVGGIRAPIQFAGGAPGQVGGLMQVNVQMPNSVQPGGYVPVVLQVGDRTSSPAVWIAVSGN